MARKESTSLTEAELRLMNVLWDRGPSTVKDVLDALPAHPPLAYTTILTTLRILEDKGYLEHDKDGRAFLYKPRVPRDQARQSAVRQILSRFFEGSAEQLVLNLLKTEKLSSDELKSLRKLIKEAQ
ncbi:MAG: BlaI/MecI/CopY family transcriptional regulator [Acidobacteria bacterium]|nr:BlaI/MecI/CopY family transcriptional regulator [Acidobacteriota bacterium]